MLTKCGEDWLPDDDKVVAWQQAYKNIDVFTELDAMACWLDANPQNRKTKRGMNRFVNSWLSRANKQGGSPPEFRNAGSPDAPVPLRSWTMADMLTHDFMDSAVMRKKWLADHGQYMSGKGVRHVD